MNGLFSQTLVIRPEFQDYSVGFIKGGSGFRAREGGFVEGEGVQGWHGIAGLALGERAQAIVGEEASGEGAEFAETGG